VFLWGWNVLPMMQTIFGVRSKFSIFPSDLKEMWIGRQIIKKGPVTNFAQIRLTGAELMWEDGRVKSSFCDLRERA
jgi:hypothetical protein